LHKRPRGAGALDDQLSAVGHDDASGRGNRVLVDRSRHMVQYAHLVSFALCTRLLMRKKLCTGCRLFRTQCLLTSVGVCASKRSLYCGNSFSPRFSIGVRSRPLFPLGSRTPFPHATRSVENRSSTEKVPFCFPSLWKIARFFFFIFTTSTDSIYFKMLSSPVSLLLNCALWGQILLLLLHPNLLDAQTFGSLCDTCNGAVGSSAASSCGSALTLVKNGEATCTDVMASNCSCCGFCDSSEDGLRAQYQAYHVCPTPDGVTPCNFCEGSTYSQRDVIVEGCTAANVGTDGNIALGFFFGMYVPSHVSLLSRVPSPHLYVFQLF